MKKSFISFSFSTKKTILWLNEQKISSYLDYNNSLKKIFTRLITIVSEKDHSIHLLSVTKNVFFTRAKIIKKKYEVCTYIYILSKQNTY